MAELQVGDEITAPVAHVAPFGVFLDHEGQSVLVRLPELSYLPLREGEIAKPGDQVRVQIFSIAEKEILGSALPFLENPFEDGERFGVGAVLRARVIDDAWTMWKRGAAWEPGAPTPDFPEYPHREHVGFRVEIELGLRFVVPEADVDQPLQIGQEVDVVVCSVHPGGRPAKVELMRSGPGTSDLPGLKSN